MAKALTIIDVQKGMFAYGDPHHGEAVVDRLAQLLDAARASGAPIFFVQHDGGEGSPLAPNSEGFDFHAALAPNPDEDVTLKRHCSVFQATDLEQKLRERGVDGLVIGGMQTEFCIDTAVRGAFERGFAVTLIADGHTTFDTPALRAEQIIAHHNHTLASGHFASVQNSAQIAFE
ncbi:MAG: cysteine hydrolase family protein [Pseudomonadota bacterium]